MKYKRKSLCLFVVEVVLIAFVVLLGCRAFESNPIFAETEKKYFSNKNDFVAALSQKNSIIYVDDIDFGGKSIQLDSSVEIVGLSQKSALKNVHFYAKGATTIDDCITIKLKNLVFDGGFDNSGVDLEQDKSFKEIFGSLRSELRCLTFDGYCNIEIENCEFKSYAAATGSAIFRNFGGAQTLSNKIQFSLKNCKFYDNVCEVATVWLNDAALDVFVSNCEFFGNRYRNTAGMLLSNLKAEIDGLYIHDNKHTTFCSVDKNNCYPNRFGGGLFLGLCDASIKNSKIKDCVSQNGGGVAMTSSSAVFENCEIINNKAILSNNGTVNPNWQYMRGGYGGGIFVLGDETKKVDFVNCNISSNFAEEGASLCAMPKTTQSVGGLINFVFCNIGLNNSQDNKAFSYYCADDNRAGKILLKGCFVVDDTTLEGSGEEPDYNFVVTKEQALLDGVISQEIIENSKIYGLQHSSNFCFSKNIKKETYSNWALSLANQTGDKTIGINPIDQSNVVDSNEGPKSNKLKIILCTVLPISVAVVAGVVLWIFLKKGRQGVTVEQEKNNINVEKSDGNEISELSEEEIRLIVENIKHKKLLSKKEIEVLQLALCGKPRKVIARELFVTEHTVKKHLASIYLKLDVKDRKELISSARKYL